MKQYVKIFYDSHIDTAINEFIEAHPNYSIDKISFGNSGVTGMDKVVVVFNIEEKYATYAVASGEYSIKE